MGIPMFVYNDGDDPEYPIAEIMSKERWAPFRHWYVNEDMSNTSIFFYPQIVCRGRRARTIRHVGFLPRPGLETETCCQVTKHLISTNE